MEQIYKVIIFITVIGLLFLIMGIAKKEKPLIQMGGGFILVSIASLLIDHFT